MAFVRLCCLIPLAFTLFSRLLLCFLHSLQAKHLQFVSGVNGVSYWMANFAWDLINAFAIVIIAFFFIAVFQTDGYQGQGLGAVFVLMVSRISFRGGVNGRGIPSFHHLGSFYIHAYMHMYSCKSLQSAQSVFPAFTLLVIA